MKHAAHERARARRYAMQALYQWDLSGEQVSAIREQFLEAEDFSKADTSYFNKTLRDVSESIETIDKKLSEYIDRPLERLDPVERAILRIGIYELLSRPDIPYRVTINEAVALTRKFGAEQGYAFVNGVLDKAAQHLRSDEYAHKNRQAKGL
jgi:N utilization substance protein B